MQGFNQLWKTYFAKFYKHYSQVKNIPDIFYNLLLIFKVDKKFNVQIKPHFEFLATYTLYKKLIYKK